ncbi:Aldo/keto reductase [Acetitomaculum ruminis DSM 5522]|uniref:Aldo/keto reductase n=1 Tax=Acetitomaculum ruminis DSM 5522 TaxID=1120918 RepID=A0A1I0ZQ73_9FIRM|nr:aldo/keto reductase [Acetitomaculum ruminis]SFB27266.1 Aldo/keto reductase [Acetitomaculum ruminis DSM 5522]
MKEIILNNGVTIPSIGYGTYKTTDGSSYFNILDAIDVGYRHLDTAKVYNNEEEVGMAVRKSRIPRKDFFITSKLDRKCLGYESAKYEFNKSLERLQMDYIDLYLLHWPRTDYGKEGFDDWKEQDIGAWKALEELYHEGKVRAIGVSNFLPHHLENLMNYANVIPCINQLELHPGYLQIEAVEYSKKLGIALEAWSPMGRARLLKNETIVNMAKKYGISPAVLCLAFCLQMQFIILPKSSNKERMIENLSALGTIISPEDMNTLISMPQSGWSGEHPDKKRVRLESALV